MSRTKKIIIAIACLVVLLLIVSYFKSNQFMIQKSIEIEAPANFVYNAINNLSYQDEWNAKVSLDTSFHIFCGDLSIGIGTQCDYKSNIYGDGNIRILFAAKNDSIVVSEASLLKSSRLYHYKIHAINDTNTLINVSATSASGWISNLWNFIHKWKLKKHVSHQLDNLNVFVTERYKQNTYNGYKVETTSLDQKYFLIQKAEINIANIDEYYTQNISALYQLALDKNLSVTGMPSALFYKWDKALGKTEMAAAIPTLSELFIANTETISLAPGSVLRVVYSGERKNISKAHQAIQDYILDHNLQHGLPIIEEYQTSITMESDPSKWVTHIYYYVTEYNTNTK